MTEIFWGPRRSKPRRKYGKKNVRPATDPHHEINHRRDFPGPILCHQDISCQISPAPPDPGCFRLSCVTKPPPRE
jgi:hypothetical protein